MTINPLREVAIPLGSEIPLRNGRRARLSASMLRGDPRRVPVYSRVRGDRSELVGRGLRLEQTSTGPVLVARISDTIHGRETATLVRDGVLTGSSITLTRGGELWRVGITERGTEHQVIG